MISIHQQNRMGQDAHQVTHGVDSPIDLLLGLSLGTHRRPFGLPFLSFQSVECYHRLCQWASAQVLGPHLVAIPHAPIPVTVSPVRHCPTLLPIPRSLPLSLDAPGVALGSDRHQLGLGLVPLAV